MSLPIPRVAQEITTELLAEIIADMNPGVRVVSSKMVGTNNYGEANVSSSARATFELEYAPDSTPKFANRVVVKMTLGEDIWPAKLFPIYENEINFYNRIRPGLDLEVVGEGTADAHQLPPDSNPQKPLSTLIVWLLA